METAKNLTNDFLSGLSLSTEIIKEGDIIKPGETFTIQFTLLNKAEMTNVIYDNPRIQVRKTEYAHPKSGEKWIRFSDKKLENGEHTSCKVKYIADKVSDGQEIASATAYAELDYCTFFSFWAYCSVPATISI